MNDKGKPETLISNSTPPESELLQLAELAFASRRIHSAHSQAPRNLVFLSPEALDMDLSDPMQRHFGDYELLEKIGRGGMGVVYRARQRTLDREVALKLLIAGPWAPSRFVERFQSEAQSAARLEHPNIVTVYESGSAHDLNYFSMRLVRGESLATRVGRHGPLPPRETARILLTVAEAVDYAHQLGVLHLDLKPGNILIDESGVPLIADFGLARRVDQALADMSGDTSGTPSYMAPEQVGSSNLLIGKQTDIYGLGSILYELLCGQPPFSGLTAQGTLDQVVNSEVRPPREVDSRIPRDLEAICLKCLGKDPKERYPTAAALADDLRAYLADLPVSVRRLPPGERLQRWVRREPRLAAAFAAVALALTVGLGATYQQWQRAEGNAAAARELIWEGRREAAIQLEQDGRGLEAISRLISNVRELEAVGETEQAEMDRLRIGLLQSQGARLIDTIVVADAQQPLATGLSADGTRLALAFSDLTLRWYDTANLEEQGRVSLETAIAPNGIQTEPWRTSDGKPRPPVLIRFIDNSHLLVTLVGYANFVRPLESDTWLIALDDAEVIEPPPGRTVAAFSPDGSKALLRDQSGQVQLWRTRPWVELAEPISGSSDRLAWRFSPGGDRLFSLGREMRDLEMLDLHSGEVRRPLLTGIESATAWSVSPDGRYLALGDEEGGLFLVEVATGEVRPLTAQRARELTWVEFSEDGSWLAAASYDGLAQVLDVETGSNVVNGDLRSDFPLLRVSVSRRQRLLIAAGDREISLWRIPEPVIRVGNAKRVGVVPARLNVTGTWYPLDWSLQQGLFASAGRDRVVRLWRLPASPTVPGRGPRQMAESVRHDPRLLIDIQWNDVRLVSPKGRPMTRSISLPQPPGFAQLVDEGRLLVVTVGPEIHAYDSRTMNERYTPVELPASPQRFLVGNDGRLVLIGFGGHGAYGHKEHLRLFDAVAGRWLDGEAALDGPIVRYAFSEDGRRIVAIGGREGMVTVLDSNGLDTVAEEYQDLYAPVVWAEFRGDELLMLTRPDDPTLGRAQLRVWDLLIDDFTAEYSLGASDPASFVVSGDDVIVAGDEYDMLLRPDGTSLRFPRLSGTTTDLNYPFIALSPDRRLLARGYRNDVEIHDARTGTLLGAPLGSDMPALAPLVSLSFTPDGGGLRMDATHRVYVHWAIEPETESVEILEAEYARLLPDVAAGPVYAPTATERGRMRAADPGAWLRAPQKPPIEVALDAKDGVSVPARAPGTPESLLDLSPFYTLGPMSVANTIWSPLPSVTRYPGGIQRIDGTWFDMRGVVFLGRPEGARGEAEVRIECLAMPERPFSAIRLLSYVGRSVGAPTGQKDAIVRIHYTDGPPAELGIHAGVEVPGYNGDDHRVPEVFFTDHVISKLNTLMMVLAAPRLDNPYKERIPRCLDVEMVSESGSLSVLGITVEGDGREGV